MQLKNLGEKNPIMCFLLMFMFIFLLTYKYYRAYTFWQNYDHNAIKLETTKLLQEQIHLESNTKI